MSMRRHDVDHCMNIQVFWWSFSNKGWPAPRIPTHTKIPTCKQLCPQIGVRSQSFFGGLGLMSAPKRKQWKKQRQRNWEREREREKRDWERRFCLWPASCRKHIQDQNSNMAAPRIRFSLFSPSSKVATQKSSWHLCTFLLSSKTQ